MAGATYYALEAEAKGSQAEAARGRGPWLQYSAGLQCISLSPCSTSVLRPRAHGRVASWLTILQRWHMAYCLGARRGGDGGNGGDDEDAALV